MPYLCSFTPRENDVQPYSYERSPLGETRIITRGLSCTTSELQRELETVCRAKPGTLYFDHISPESVDTWVKHYADNGGKMYINREGFE